MVMPAAIRTLHQKQKRAEQSRFLIEALAEIFVGGVNLQPLINRNENRADDDERERLAEIILDEADPAFVSLARHGEKRDRAGLRGENGKADRSPANTFVALEIVAETFATARAPESIERYRQNRRDEDEVIEPIHENRTVKR